MSDFLSDCGRASLDGWRGGRQRRYGKRLGNVARLNRERCVDVDFKAPHLVNYRHAFHAGNFADVVKHALLTRLIDYLKRKEKPFRVLDTHAGRGSYDLSSIEAMRTGEHLSGITALLASETAGHELLEGYVRVVRALSAERGAPSYPGSPLLARRLLRRQDRLSAYELHPVDAQALTAEFEADVQVKAIELDGWLALGAHVPPKEKRGLVLIDPPFEQPQEVERIVEGLARAYRRWPGGIYAIWYPIKRPAERDRLHGLLTESGIADVVAAEFFREAFTADERLVGSGLIVVNPPYTFAAEALAVMQLLKPVLAKDRTADCGIIALADEAG